MESNLTLSGSAAFLSSASPFSQDAMANLSRLGLGGGAIEHEPVLGGGDLHRLAVMDLAGEHHLGERVLHIFLDDALQGPRAIGRVIALLP